MCELPFSFPVFYYCAIKPEIPRNQYRTVNMLLRGITMINSLESVGDVPFLDSTPCSAYASGERPIPEAELDVINSLDRCEIVNRIKNLPMQSYVKSASRLITYITEVAPLDDTRTSHLLELAKDKEHIEEFLAEAFLISLKCPPNRVKRLKNIEKRALERGDFSMFSQQKKQDTDPTEHPGYEPNTKPDSSIYFPFENNLVFDYVIRRKRLSIDADLENLQSYVRGTLLDSPANNKEQDIVLYITEEACNRFIDEFTRIGKANICELYDSVDEILRKIHEDDSLKRSRYPLCLVEIPSDISAADQDSIVQTLISLFNHKSPGCFGLRKSTAITSNAILRFVATPRRIVRSDIKSGKYQMRSDQRPTGHETSKNKEHS